MSRCSRCVMDVSAREITFDEKGTCNFCTQALKALDQPVLSYPPYTKNRYDVLIGLSGGVDSSMALIEARDSGYNILAFTVDTGYNKPEADENILQLVETLKIPFYRYTIDLAKFKELQSAFIQSGVRNIEIPTDHILMAVSFELAAKHGIKTIISGGNVATESIMPPSWGYSARDLVHIKDIYRKYAGKNLSGLPTCSLFQWNLYRWWYGIKIFYILDQIDYNREHAEKYLTEKYGFKSTGEKHEENFFTWWFQNYYLFIKFGIDKRKAHYSSMILSGQMSRKDALDKLQLNPVYPALGIEKKVMKYAKHAHEDYKMDKKYERIARLIKFVV